MAYGVVILGYSMPDLSLEATILALKEIGESFLATEPTVASCCVNLVPRCKECGDDVPVITA
jgi:hypothetical protein